MPKNNLTQNGYPLFKLTAIAALLAGAMPLSALAETQRFNIPAQSLDNALTELADSANLKLLYQVEMVKNKKSQSLSGSYSPQQALQKMLAGTGITAQTGSNGAVILAKNEASFEVADNQNTSKNETQTPAKTTTEEPTVLETVNVTDKAKRDVTDPYNQDYTLPNATAGTKTDTPIMETPLNVQVISKQVLKDQQVINLGDALKNVSGVTTGSFSYGFGNYGAPTQQITLRGFASQTFYRNGFRLQQGSASRDMSNVESIEVLKGPAAILYGLTEPGGMVNVITKQPQATPYYSVNQQFGSYDLYRTTVDATGPIADNKNVLFRVNLSYQNSGSFRDLISNENIFVSPVLKWIISPQTQVTVEMEYQHKNFTTDPSFIPIINGQLYKMPINTNYGEYSPGVQDIYFGGLSWSHQFNNDWSIKHRVSVNSDHSNIPISSYPYFQTADPSTYAFFKLYAPTIAPNSVYSLAYTNQTFTNNTYSTNMDLTGHFDTFGLKHTLLLGGDYYRLTSTTGGSSDFNTFYGWFGGGSPPSSNSVYNPVHPGNNYPAAPYDPTSWLGTIVNTDQFGFYVQDQIKLPYNIHVMGGIRYQNIHQETFNKDSLGTKSQQPSQSQDAVTPRVGILWQPQKWVSLYANYVENFGANSGRTWPNNQVVPPTSASQYEGGIKMEFFDGRLRASFAYYDLTKTNIASTDPVVSHLCGGIRCSVAVGAARSRGPELDIQGEILPGWNVIATYANTSINITKTDTQNSSFIGLYPVGSRYWGVPRNTSTVFSTYDFQTDTLKGLKIGAGVNMQDSQLACCTSPLTKVPGFATVDLLAAYNLNVGKSKVTAQVNVKNLLNKYYVLGGGIDSTSGMFATFGQPLTFMGSIGIQY